MEHGFFTLRGQHGLADDVGVLLHHLSALPEARLDAAFTGIATGGSAALLNRPPAATGDKDTFIKAVMEVSGVVAAAPRQGSSADAGPGPLAPDQIALLISARDVLATLARPATVESIRITREYSRAMPLRRICGKIVRLVGRVFGRRGPAEEKAAPGSRRSVRFGRSLALQMRAWQLFTLGLVGVTVALSIYALTGRGLLREIDLTSAKFGLLASDMEVAERADAPVFMALRGFGSDNVQHPKPAHYVERYCEAIDRTVSPERFATRQQQRLCDRYDGHNEALQQLFLRLRYWHWQPPGQWFPIDDGCPPGETPRHETGGCTPATAGGRPAPRPEPTPRPETVPMVRNGGATNGLSLPSSGGEAMAATNSIERLMEGGGVAPAVPPAGAALQPASALRQIQHLRLEVVTAQVILQATTEYLLPCLYAMLGALAAALGNLARKAEDATLSFGDGGATFRTLVLGVLFGAVIGLFASQVAPAVQTGGSANAASLTPAALSLLAGYSVAQVFQFFDGLSVRVFGPRAPVGTPTG